jgi:serine/threonine protein kinase
MADQPSREEQIFTAVLRFTTREERAACLTAACAGDAALRQRVEALLQAHERAGDSLDPDVTVKSPPSPDLPLVEPVTEKPGDRIGRYKLLQEIGEGGCGVVYMAEQEQPVRRRVALKVVKLGMDTKQVVARFEAERQVLALMDHPHIAKVLDAGATGTGRPFFVMELVRGVPITEYCDQHNLSTRERLDLFVDICRAVQHAHQKGIIHRDIKPSNILVTLRDGAPVPKVIDFGIAKAIDRPLTEKTVFTRFEQFMGTPAYMSPEQAEMSGLDVDTRSDVYALGVLLYELLTGRTPFDAKRLAEGGVDEIRRIIREEEPPSPSTRISTLDASEQTTVARRRGSEPPKLIHTVRGDLDWIVMKAMEKDRTRRYETANGLAMDIIRFLGNEPIVARPPSNLYRFQKLVRRNKLAVAAAAAIAMALLMGAVVSSWQAVRASRAEAAARQERDAATRARQQAEAINRFLTEDLLYQATPDQNAREKKVTMEEVLERATRKLDQNAEIARQPELEATLRLAVGNTYFKLGILGEAERHLRRAVALRRSALGPEHRDTLAAQYALAEFLDLGVREFDEAEALSRETWQGRQRLLGDDNRDTLASLARYAQTLADQRKLPEAERLTRQCLETSERVLGPDDYDTIVALGNLAYVLADRGDLMQAERCTREEVARFLRAGLADRDEALYAVNNLALFRCVQGHPEEAETLLVEARPRAARVFGVEHVITLHLQHVLARVLAEEGKLDEAEVLARETLAARRRVTPGHEGIGRTLLVLGRVLVEKGKLDEAEPLLREALALFREQYAMKPELAAQAANWLGAIQLARKAYPEAESLLLSGSDQFFVPTAGLSPKERRLAVGHIVTLYQDWGKPEQGATWQVKLDELAKMQTSQDTR